MPDLPEEVRNTIKFHFVDNIDQILKIALAPGKNARSGTQIKIAAKRRAATAGAK
jgi:hypothetical protein